MPLNDLNKELYKENSQSIAQRTHEQSEYDPTLNSGSSSSPFEGEEHWHEVQKGLSPKGKKILKISLITFAIIVLTISGGYLYQWWLKNAFHQDRVSIWFEGPKEADSTQPIKYIVHYKNANRVTLKNAEIQLSFSGNFQPTNNVNLKKLSPTSSKFFIGDIKPNSEEAIELNGVFYAPKDTPIYLHGIINFTPSNSAKQLAMENQIGVNITAAPVILSVASPQQAVDGDSLIYIIDYKNLDTRLMSGMQIRVNFPDGFKVVNAQPQASEQGSYWYIGNLDPNESGKITIQGQISGADGDSKDMTASIGQVDDDGKFVVYNKQDTNTHIVSPVLAVKQGLEGSTDGVVHAGDVLKYVVSFQNTGAIGLRDAIVTAQIDGKILDFSKINVENGSFDGKSGTIIWKASDVPELASINPKAGGQVRFQIPVKEIIPIDDKTDKNFVITSIAKIDSPDIPTPIDSNKIIGSNKLEVKLATKVIFDTKGYYKDVNIQNSGPIPMQSGQETTFAIHWSIMNISNDITNAKVIGSLPSGVRWTGTVYPLSSKVTFNPRTNQIIWDAGDVPAGTGPLDPQKEVEFQVGVTPQINQVGNPITLTNKSSFTATDVFTKQDISLEGAPKDTQLYEDPTVSVLNGKVAK